jgi:hypothetical protein
MPLLAIVVPMKILVRARSVLSVIAGIDILRRCRYEDIAWADLMALMPNCLLGIVLGLAFYKMLGSKALARGLSVLVVLYEAFSTRPLRGGCPAAFIASRRGDAARTDGFHFCRTRLMRLDGPRDITPPG